MSRPSDIPEDVYEAANKADILCQRNHCQRSGCNGFLCLNALEVAMIAERERCAKRAGAYLSPGDPVIDAILGRGREGGQ